jgi:3-carboxy-cis,cis-muconate cycloisomerase
MSYTLAFSPLQQAMFADADVVKLFSAENEMAAILRFEVELAKAQENCGRVPAGTAMAIAAAAALLTCEGPTFDASVAQDGVAIPAVVALLKTAVGANVAPYVHVNATSQDVIDSALMMRASAAVALIRKNLESVTLRLEQLETSFGQRALMGRTRMQRALPMTVVDRLTVWRQAVASSDALLSQLAFPLQLSGPVGTTNDDKVKTHLAAALGLSIKPHSWQTDRTPVLALGNASANVTAALGKIGVDIGLMMQNEFTEIKLRGGGSSSAMPHKQNPVKAEILVALARWNATLLAGLHQAAIHEQERSGAAWTLEWLALPQMICATAGAARLGRELLESVESMGA